MVKLFDFKFLILLGLAIIIYLLYRELESQRVKIQECENKILSLTNVIENKKESQKNTLQSTFDILTLRKEEAINEQALEQEKAQALKQAYEQALKQDSEQAQDNNIKLDGLHLSLPSDMLIENTSDSETSKKTSVHLEVYSNDSAIDSKNIFVASTVITSDIVPIDEFLSGKWCNPDSKISIYNANDKQCKENVELVVMNTEPIVMNTEPVEPVVMNVEPVVMNVEPVVMNVEPVVMNTEPVVEPVVEPAVADTETVKEQPKYNITNLLKMKISELQEIAKQRNISIDKNTNGVIKNKTKQELAQEIL
jgi:hypothetical protein